MVSQRDAAFKQNFNPFRAPEDAACWTPGTGLLSNNGSSSTRATGTKCPFQTESDTPGMLPVLALNTCNLKKPQVVLSSLNHQFCVLATNPSVSQKLAGPNCIGAALQPTCTSPGPALKVCTGGRRVLNILLPTPEADHTGTKAHPDTNFPNPQF